MISYGGIWDMCNLMYESHRKISGAVNDFLLDIGEDNQHINKVIDFESFVKSFDLLNGSQSVVVEYYIYNCLIGGNNGIHKIGGKDYDPRIREDFTFIMEKTCDLD